MNQFFQCNKLFEFDVNFKSLSKISLIHAINTFVKSVINMNANILIPSKLKNTKAFNQFLFNLKIKIKLKEL